MKPNNPPAFPSATAPSVHGCWGMTLRDYFAAAAFPAVAAHLQERFKARIFDFYSELDMGILADGCYLAADTMLKNRQTRSTAQVNALDAARYRWLRDVATGSSEAAMNMLFGAYAWDSDSADAAIDAAMAAQEGK